MVQVGTVAWFGVLVGAVWAAHWGAEHVSEPLQKLERARGLTAAAGGAFVGFALATPEISITASSALLGVSEVGLGLMIGGNVLSLPLLTTIAYLASGRVRGERADDVTAAVDGGAGRGDGDVRDDDAPRAVGHTLLVEPAAGSVIALPYVGIVALVGLLTVPAGWRGLQPVDGWIMLAVYAAYFGQAVLRGRREGGGEDVDWAASEVSYAAAGLLAVVVAAFLIVRSTEHLVGALGVSGLFGGLFITAPVGLAPEAFGTWHVVRSGDVTAGAVDVITDGAVTMTLAFFPLALVGLPLRNFRLYWVSLLFALALSVVYAAFVYWGPEGYGFARWQVVAFDGVYLVYVLVVVVWVLDVV